MTIPTREEALNAVQEMLSSAAEEYYGDASDASATIRSYIESHTGEPVAWRYRQIGMSTWNYSGERLGADYDKFYEYEPLYASPVQTDHVAEVGKMVALTQGIVG